MLVTQQSLCDVCTSCSRLMRTGLKLGTPVNSRDGYSRRILNDSSPSPNENMPNLTSPLKLHTGKGFCHRSRTPLEDHDPNSQDSGYGVSEDSKSPANFKFAEPNGFAPKRLSVLYESPRRNLSPTFALYEPTSPSSCSDSQDDNFLDMFRAQNQMDDESVLPQGLGSLLSNPIMDKSREKTPSPFKIHNNSAHRARRYFSENSTPLRRISNSEDTYRIKRPMSRPLSPGSKRSKPLSERNSPLPTPREKQKGTLFQYGFTKYSSSPLPPSERSPIASKYLSASDSNLSIKLALQRSTQEDLIGDFSRPFALPLMSGKHQDLKAISCETLAQLISGDFNDRIASFKIIDCRYPYEFEAGHVKGAVNLYTPEQIKKELMDNLKPAAPATSTSASDKRNILVFHCEFSSERGPKLSRYLRKEDRAENRYPWLNYPELYLLHGGYQAFFENHSHLCEPCAYKPMHDPAHASDLKHFRAKSKTWSGSNKRAVRCLSRLGF